MPGNKGAGNWSLQIRLLRSSSLTDRLPMRSSENALLRRAPRVRGKSQVALVNCRPPLPDCTRRVVGPASWPVLACQGGTGFSLSRQGGPQPRLLIHRTLADAGRLWSFDAQLRYPNLLSYCRQTRRNADGARDISSRMARAAIG